jgi:glycosyltransferase involved in cell wall biosynthesis
LSSVNVIFLGNFLYPEGMAGTKRIQYFVDSVRAIRGNVVRILLLRQSQPGNHASQSVGVFKGVSYQTIGADLQSGWRLPWRLSRYLLEGSVFLRNHRLHGYRNILFVYGEPNLENIFFILLARVLGYRVIIDVVEDFYLIPGNARVAARLKAASSRFFSKHMGWFADGMIVISTYLREKFVEIGVGKFPVFLIPVSVDINKVTSSDEGFHNPVRIFYSGSFGEKDGVDKLIRAFEKCSQKCPDVELMLTGKGIKERIDTIENQIAQSPLANRIRYLGFLPDERYFDLLNSSDILCVVRVKSDFADRGFPFKLGEFLATGRPVIASRMGDVPSYLSHKKSAYLVEPGSIESIALALEFLVENEEMALSIGQGGRRVAEEKFDARVNGRKLIDAIDELDRISS